MEKLTEVRAAIVKAVPELSRPYGWHDASGDYHETERPIRLADVLRAMQTQNYMPKKAWIFKGWNLAADFLDDQSHSTITFLHSILCN